MAVGRVLSQSPRTSSVCSPGWGAALIGGSAWLGNLGARPGWELLVDEHRTPGGDLRILQRPKHAAHRRHAGVGVLEDLAPVHLGFGAEAFRDALTQSWPGRAVVLGVGWCVEV